MFGGEKEYFNYKTLIFGKVEKEDLDKVLLTFDSE